MGRDRYRFGEDGFPHFMTSTSVAWLPVFCNPSFAEVIFDSWRFLQRMRQIKIIAFVLMENHLHWIASGPKLAQRVKEFKSYTARTILNLMMQKKYSTLLSELKYFKQAKRKDQEFQFWQEGCHPKLIEDETVMRQKIEYIHNNPLRRGYVEDPIHWRYSSARCYARKTGLLEVCTDW
ncbi:transposase [Stieleria sp. JC731]|uniref:REP-associated tyrosine transposase n=1 Tax=Pirellulaceae TaxID=2691357 RepID=UPI001E2B0859|nr:transposase [Stieleria sp. JC731]MCC9603862.1 transposase [Stieleria sp. JC731]